MKIFIIRHGETISIKLEKNDLNFSIVEMDGATFT